MNTGVPTSRDEIGIDPTTVEIIDTLDFGSTNTNNNLNNKKNHTKEIIIKILFAFGILALMGLIAFGVYFYLHLGKEKVQKKPKFVLDNKTVFVGANLSQSILDYGSFAAVDIADCTLDTSKVDTSKAGVYEYSMMCHNDKYTGKITVKEKYPFEITANIVYKTSSDVLIPSEFISGSNDYTYAIKDNNLTNYLYTPGGPYYVLLDIENTKDNTKGTVSSILYVTESKVRSNLTCTGPVKETNTAFKLSYQISDVFVFDAFKNYLNVPARIYTFANLDVEKYVELIGQIENGKITIDDISGYALRDDVNNTIRIAVDLTDEILNEETDGIRLNYNNIKKYYEDNKYTCQ